MLNELIDSTNIYAIVAVFSVLLFIISPVVAIVAALLLPKNILTQQLSPRSQSNLPLWVLRNLAAVVLLVMGTVMLFTPGQGILTIFIAFLISDFPYKRQIQKRVIMRPTILKSLNKIRMRFGIAPLLLPGQAELGDKGKMIR